MSKPILDGMTDSQRYDHYEKRSKPEMQMIHRLTSTEASLYSMCDMLAHVRELIDGTSKIRHKELTKDVLDDIVAFSTSLREMVESVHDMIEGDLNTEYEMSEEAKARLKKRRGPMVGRPGPPKTPTVARKPR